jgi:hypothetical protein
MENYRTGRYRIVVCMLAAGMLLSGCANNTAVTAYGSAAISSEPESAKVINLRDGSEIGSTPLV